MIKKLINFLRESNAEKVDQEVEYLISKMPRIFENDDKAKLAYLSGVQNTFQLIYNGMENKK